MRQINWIVIHCTATQPETRPESIVNHWKNTLGWRDPGYHILIEADGTIHILADFSKVTNGVRGRNQNSIHISYIGGIDREGFPFDTRTPAQKAKLLEWVLKALEWVKLHQDTVPDIVGHHDLYAGKACPSFPALKEYSWITVGNHAA